MRVMFGPRRTLPPPRIAVDVGQFVETPASLIGYIPLSPIKKSDYQLDIQGIDPWTSRMRSVRATTVPNARDVINMYDETWRLGSAAVT